MQWYYELQIRVLLLVSPSRLFEKINQLPWYKSMLEEWISHQNLEPNCKVLELGCATGVLSNYLSTLSHVPTGVDRSKKMIDRAKENYPHLNFYVEDATKLPFESNTFDVLLASSLVNIIDEKEKLLLEMKRLVKAEGSISFLVPLQGFNNKNLTKLNNSLGLKGFSKSALKMWHNSAPKMSLEEIEMLLSSCGLSISHSYFYLDGMVGAFVVKV